MKSKLISKKEHILCLTAVALLLVITAVFLFKDQELTQIPAVLATARLPFLLFAVLAMAVFFVLEARATQLLLHTMIEKRGFGSFCRYALIDFYFSSITPGCSGGQPSQLYFMHRDKIPLSASSLSVLTFNMAYHLAVLLVAGAAFFISGLELFSSIGAFKYLLIFGIAAQLVLIIVYLLAIFHPRLASFLVSCAIRVLAKLRIVKNHADAIVKAEAQIADYCRGACYMRQHPLLLLRVILLCCGHILALYSIPFWVLLAFGVSGQGFFTLIALQAALTLSVESLPIPGGLGVTEGGFMLIYSSIVGAELLIPVLLLTRCINYYLGLAAGGIVSVISLRSRHDSKIKHLLGAADKVGSYASPRA